MEERIVRTDAHSAGVLVTPLRQQVCWQMSENMLFDVPADKLWDLSPQPFRRCSERIARFFVLGHSSEIRRGHPNPSLAHAVQQGGPKLFEPARKGAFYASLKIVGKLAAVLQVEAAELLKTPPGKETA
jgi:hypothetical protein